jgi:hypothetical protein
MRTDPRRALHLGVLVGVSTAGYAASLAGVTMLQSASDRATIGAREPLVRTTAVVAADHDAVEQVMRDATDRYTEIAGRYAALDPGIGDLEKTLDKLDILTHHITDSAASLPTRVKLPAVNPAQAPVAAPRIHAVTGASGAG